MSVVINEVDVDSVEPAEAPAGAPAAPARGKLDLDELTAMLRRDDARRARLWAD